METACETHDEEKTAKNENFYRDCWADAKPYGTQATSPFSSGHRHFDREVQRVVLHYLIHSTERTSSSSSAAADSLSEVYEIPHIYENGKVVTTFTRASQGTLSCAG
jgi:hypothetical protein